MIDRLKRAIKMLEETWDFDPACGEITKRIGIALADVRSLASELAKPAGSTRATNNLTEALELVEQVAPGVLPLQRAGRLMREALDDLRAVSAQLAKLAEALRSAREEPLRDLRKWLIWRIEKHELAANECHDKGRFDLWSEQLKSTEAFGQVLAQVDRLLHSTQSGAPDGT